MNDYSKFVENSRKWLKEYIQTNHLESIILGISGGIDSTVSAVIASPVCEELDVLLIGRSLSTKTNKKDEIKVANLVGTTFCTDYKEIDIQPVYTSILGMLHTQEGLSTALQYGNIKARIRMLYLRHLASIHKGIVLDNDNFTEWNLGFWTVAGDSPMDINLGLHHLWKTEIYDLARYLANEECGGIQSYAIIASMNLTPTDGNGVSNSDCEQFGLDNYEQVDDVLKTMYYRDDLEQVFSPNEDQYIRLIDSYNEQGVDKVMLLHQNTEFKRKPAPIMPSKIELGL